MSYLEWHGNQLRVQVSVPKAAQKVLGKKRLTRGLHTDSLPLANLKKLPIVRAFHKEIDDALKAAAGQQHPGHDPLVEEAFALKAEMELEKDEADQRGLVDDEGRFLPVIPDYVADRAEQIEAEQGYERAAFFHQVATGQATPLATLVPRWLNERQDKPRIRRDYERAVHKFIRWLEAEGLQGSAEAATRRLAGDYVSTTMIEPAINWKTANKDISALSSFWKWMVRKGRATENIWERQSLHKPKRQDPDHKKRPFTDDEVRVLLTGIDDPLLLDAMQIAALSGLRVAELAAMRVADCEGGAMLVRESKTEAGRYRRVPIHSAVVALIERRCRGKQPAALLFDELKEEADEREQIISKRFTRARRRLGVDEVPEGHRQSRIDFHSFRRWFAAKARDALQDGASGYDAYTIADVLGHERENAPLGLAMTMGRYAGSASSGAMRACVEAVQLPRPLPGNHA